MNNVPSEVLDLTGVPCPQNSARALIAIEGLDPGELILITVDSGEPIDNVPPSLAEEGHIIVQKEQIGDKWNLIVQRGDD